MKRFFHISLALVLSLTMMFVGRGVDIVRCAHSGTVKMVTCLGSMSQDENGCSPTSDCMSIEHLELSPTEAAQSLDFDFHVLQPTVAILPNYPFTLFNPHDFRQWVQPLCTAVKGPPRAYLNLLQVLLI